MQKVGGREDRRGRSVFSQVNCLVKSTGNVANKFIIEEKWHDN